MSSFYNDVVSGDKITAAWMNAVEDGLGSGTPALGYDYIFWVDGSTYYVRNGKTGEREDATNFADLVNEKILDLYDSASGVGGSYAVLGGAYTVTKTINGRPGIHGYGMGRCGHNVSYDRLGTIITATTDTPIFKFDNPDSTALYHQGIHHFWLEGDSKITTTAVVDLNPTSQDLADIFLEDLSIVNAKYGIRINNATAAKNIWNIFVERCFIELCTDSGLKVTSSTDQKISQCRFDRNHFYNNNTSSGNGALEFDGLKTRGNTITNNTFELEQKNAIYMGDKACYNLIGNNMVVDAGEAVADTYDGISLNDVDYINVNGNTAVIKNSSKMRYGLYADSSCTWCAANGNLLVGHVAGMVQSSGAGMDWSYASNLTYPR